MLCRVHQVALEIKEAKPHRMDSIINNRRGIRSGKVQETSAKEKIRHGTFNAHDRQHIPSQGELTAKISEDLNDQGFSVMDNFVDEHVIEAILHDVKTLYQKKDNFVPGTLSSKHGSLSNNDGQPLGENSIRGDKVMWLNNTSGATHSAIRTAERSMNSIVSILNKSNLMQGCAMRSRSRIMVACYPGNGTKYKRHVDNPAGDGRKMTFILYLNKNYERKRDGGVLRMYPRDSQCYYDIEPIAGRLVVFWSDLRNPHEVLPTFRERFAISVWYFDIIERARALLNCELLSTGK